MSDELPKQPPTGEQVTLLLESVQQGDRQAGEELLPLLYGELRRLAASRMAREKPGQTLQPTALVHEVYLRLLKDENLGWDGKGHFFAAAAEAMRRILIERARHHGRLRHGGEQRRITLDEGVAKEEPEAEELLELDRCLSRLEDRDATMAQVVKLRYFAGLTVDETASALNISPRQVNRHWTSARAWLRREMES